MTEEPEFDFDDNSIVHALRGLDRDVEIQPFEITRHLTEHRKRQHRVRMGSIVGVCAVSLAVVITLIAAPSPDLIRPRSKSLVASISAQSLSATQKTSSESPTLSPISDGDLRLLEAERDRLRREVATSLVRQSKQIHRQMRETASVSMEHPVRFSKAF